jgi:hypothetical protein
VDPRSALALLLGPAILGGTATAQEPTAASPDPAFVELVGPGEAVFVQQPFRLRVRFGIEREFLRNDVLQPFARTLDVPVQVRLPWLGAPSGAVPIERTSTLSGDARASFALDDRWAEAVRLPDEERGGRTFQVLAIERAFLAQQPGELVVPAPRLELTRAASAPEDELFGPAPATGERVSVLGQPLVLRIQPLPEIGRPTSFSGAVGRFTIHAEARPRELEVGESLELALVIEGDGNLESFEAPPLAALDGFRVFATRDEPGPTRRTLIHQLAPLHDGVTEIPALALVVFDPTSDPPRYVSLRSEPIPLRVRALREPARTTLPASTAESERVLLVALGLGGLLALTGLGVLLVRSRRPASPVQPELFVRAEPAQDDGRLREIAREGSDAGAAFTEFLAARLGCHPAAVIDHDLGRRLSDAGVSRELCERTARAMERLLATRYGGVGVVERAELAALARELETAFGSSTRTRT